jgi:hypothetical protein
VFKQGRTLAVVGATIGLAVAYFSGRIVSSLLYEVRASGSDDPDRRHGPCRRHRARRDGHPRLRGGAASILRAFVVPVVSTCRAISEPDGSM